MRFFNTSGRVVPADHYCIPPLTRVDLDDVLQLVRNKRYFVLHVPRQTGKTSVLLALRNLLNGGEIGNYRCVYFNVEAGQAAREDTARAMRSIFRELAIRARSTLGDELVVGRGCRGDGVGDVMPRRHATTADGLCPGRACADMTGSGDRSDMR